MNDDIMNDITAYADALKQQHFSVSFSCFDKVFTHYYSTLLLYEVHQPSVCAYLKSNPKTKGLCVINKSLIKKNPPKNAFYGCCYAGVEEYIIPLLKNNDVIACVHITGFRGVLDEAEKQMQMIKSACDERFCSLYNELATDVPKMDELIRLVKPFEYMFCALYDYCSRHPFEDSPEAQLYHSILDYIYNNYMNKISASDISSKLNYSESYLRHIFQRFSGTTINKFINNIRLNEAEIMLHNPSKNITAISANCGFCDANYFSDVFKKKYGLSPKKYRKSILQI